MCDFFACGSTRRKSQMGKRKRVREREKGVNIRNYFARVYATAKKLIPSMHVGATISIVVLRAHRSGKRNAFADSNEESSRHLVKIIAVCSSSAAQEIKIVFTYTMSPFVTTSIHTVNVQNWISRIESARMLSPISPFYAR